MDPVREHNGIHYYFAHFSHPENKWVLNNQRFLLSPGDELFGQYITSNWFNWPMTQDKGMKFAVIGVKKRSVRGQVIDILNSNYPIYNNINNFVEIFECHKDKTKELVNKKVDRRETFYGNKNPSNKLYIRFIYHKEKLLATLPEFELYNV